MQLVSEFLKYEIWNTGHCDYLGNNFGFFDMEAKVVAAVKIEKM